MPGGPYPPPEVIASWPKPNYIDPETRGPALVVTCAILSGIGVVLVAARLYARLVITKAPGLDDAIIVFALLLATGSSIISIYGVKACYSGYHIWDIPISGYVAFRLNAWLSQLFNVAALCAIKISLLLFYRRLSVKFSKLFLWATYVGIGYNVAHFFVAAMTLGLECRPIAAYWLAMDPAWIAAGHTYSCAKIENIVLPVYSVLSVISDFYSTTLPLCLVYSLKMHRRQRMSLYGLFALGYLVVGAGIARTVFVNRVENETYDTTWVYYDAILWVTVETYVAIFCASAPGLKPFIKKFFVEPMIQSTPSRNRHRSIYVFGSSGKKRERLENPSEPRLNDLKCDEESWTRDGLAVELSEFDNQAEDKKMRATVHEMIEFLNDRSHHSVIANETSAGLRQSPEDDQHEQYQKAQQKPNSQDELWHRRQLSQNTAHNMVDRHSYNSEEPILEGPQILDHRIYSRSCQVVPATLRNLPPIPPERAYTPHGRASSFATISAFPMPQARASSRVGKAEAEVIDHGDNDFKLPLQSTGEKSPTSMRLMTPTQHHVQSKSKAS